MLLAFIVIEKKKPMKTDFLIHVVILLTALFLSCSSEPGVDVPEEENEQPVLTVSAAQTINVSATGGSSVILVSTNQGSWSAGSNQTWCKISDKTAGQFTIAVDPNGTAVARDATVTVTAGAALPLQIIVNQRANTSQDSEDFGYGDEQKWD